VGDQGGHYPGGGGFTAASEAAAHLRGEWGWWVGAGRHGQRPHVCTRGVRVLRVLTGRPLDTSWLEKAPLRWASGPQCGADGWEGRQYGCPFQPPISKRGFSRTGGADSHQH